MSEESKPTPTPAPQDAILGCVLSEPGCSCPKCSLFRDLPQDELFLAKQLLKKKFSERDLEKNGEVTNHEIVTETIFLMKERLGFLSAKKMEEGRFDDARVYETLIDRCNALLREIDESYARVTNLTADEAIAKIKAAKLDKYVKFMMTATIREIATNGTALEEELSFGRRARIGLRNAFGYLGIDVTTLKRS